MFQATQISTAHFSYSKLTNSFAAFASDFAGGFSQLFDQVFDDACDQGFKLVSERTGDEVVVTYKEAERNVFGEILAWVFVPYRNNAFEKVIIFND